MNAIFRRRAVLGSLVAGLAPWAAAQGAFPNRTITFVTPFPAGSTPDALCRAIAREIQQETGQAVVIDNKPGASTLLAAQTAAKAAPDGYTVFITGNTTFTANRHLFKKLPYDPDRDFAPVTAISKGAFYLLVNPQYTAVHTLQEFLQLAKRGPGTLTYADSSATQRMLGEALQQSSGVKLTRIPYKTGFQAMPDLMGGRINLIFTDSAMAQVRDGKLRALAISDTKRSTVAPDVPTLQEAGVRGADITFWLVAHVPAGTPASVIERLRELIASTAKSTGVLQVHSTVGTYPYHTTPAELLSQERSEAAEWGRLVKAAGIEPE